MIVLLCTRPSVRTLEIISLALYLRLRVLIHLFLHLSYALIITDDTCLQVSRIYCQFRNWEILDFVSYSTSRCTETYHSSAPHDVNISFTIIPQLGHAVFIRMLMDFALVSWSYPVDALVASTRAVSMGKYQICSD